MKSTCISFRDIPVNAISDKDGHESTVYRSLIISTETIEKSKGTEVRIDTEKTGRGRAERITEIEMLAIMNRKTCIIKIRREVLAPQPYIDIIPQSEELETEEHDKELVLREKEIKLRNQRLRERASF